jgi:hypothetical protein
MARMKKRPPYKPPVTAPPRPAFVTTGLINGSLVRAGVVAVADHDKRNSSGAPVAFDGFPPAWVHHYTKIAGSDVRLAYLDRKDDLPAPAVLATKLPKAGETIFVVNNAGEMRLAVFLNRIGDTFHFVPSFQTTLGDSGGAVLNSAGELLGHVTYGTTSPFYHALLQREPV